MHSEYCVIPQEAADAVNETKRRGGRVICVGTTSCRTVESWAGEDGMLKASAGKTYWRPMGRRYGSATAFFPSATPCLLRITLTHRYKNSPEPSQGSGDSYHQDVCSGGAAERRAASYIRR